MLTLLFFLPLLSLGLGLSWLGGQVLWGVLSPRCDPARWPEVQATVMSHRAEWKAQGRSNRIPVSSGPQTERVSVAVTVRLEDGTLAEVYPPELHHMALSQPPELNFGQFLAAADALALDEARRRLPAGQTIPVLAAPQRQRAVRVTADGERWTAAYSRGTLASRPVSLLAALLLLGAGLLMTLVAALPLSGIWADLSRP